MEGDAGETGELNNTQISIHTLRVEGDVSSLGTPSCVPYISIHTLRVEGDWGVTCDGSQRCLISIHTLRMEGDVHLDRLR